MCKQNSDLMEINNSLEAQILSLKAELDSRAATNDGNFIQPGAPSQPELLLSGEVKSMIALEMKPIHEKLHQLSRMITSIATKDATTLPTSAPTRVTYATKAANPRNNKQSSDIRIPSQTNVASPSAGSYLIFENISQNQADSKIEFTICLNDRLFDKGLYPKIAPEHILNISKYSKHPNSYLIQFCSVKLAKDINLSKRAFYGPKDKPEDNIYIYPLLSPKERSMVNKKISEFIKLQTPEKNFRVYSSGFVIKLVNPTTKARVFYSALSQTAPANFLEMHEQKLFHSGNPAMQL